MRLLLVEDDEILGGGLPAALDDAGYVAGWFKDPDSATELARIREYDVIF